MNNEEFNQVDINIAKKQFYNDNTDLDKILETIKLAISKLKLLIFYLYFFFNFY